MVAKLSSASTISAASFAASVPVRPMATPMSARLSAGASFTPSPVIATAAPPACSASTRRSLCSGSVRAKTSISLRRARSSSGAERVDLRAGQHVVGVLEAQGTGDGATRSRRDRR
jgi:hypothetical protein